MNNYKEKYLKYKLKYIELKKNSNNKVGNGNVGKFNIIQQMNLFKEKISTYSVDLDKTIIDLDFAEKIIKGYINYSVDENILNINIKCPIYYSVNIYNNTLSIPGLSVYLMEHMDDEFNIENIHKLFNNSIKGKHILFMPSQKEINGILLKDLVEILELHSVNSTIFNLNIELVSNKIFNHLENEKDTFEYEMIKIDNSNEYDDYIDISNYFNI